MTCCNSKRVHDCEAKQSLSLFVQQHSHGSRGMSAKARSDVPPDAHGDGDGGEGLQGDQPPLEPPWLQKPQ